LDPDSVYVANEINWLMHFYLNTNRVADARRVADFAGEVYSFSGLTTKAEFFEATGDDAQAYEWYSKIAESYDDADPVMDFCLRLTRTGNASYLKKETDKIFPGGTQTVRFNDFQSAPDDGAMRRGSSQLAQQAGLKLGDVIVAINGIRVHSVAQYDCERMLLTTPELDLIVWQGDGYHEIKASPPGHRFGVDLANFSKN